MSAAGRLQRGIRKFLLASPDGATVAALHLNANMDNVVQSESVRRALATMPDVYIDRWKIGESGHWCAVWAAVHVPDHCPRPTTKPRVGKFT